MKAPEKKASPAKKKKPAKKRTSADDEDSSSSSESPAPRGSGSASAPAIFDERIEIRERCKGVHCVDLGESFPTSIYLKKSASIQPRTSLSKFGG